MRLAIGAALVLAIVGPVRADAGLTGAVAASYFARTEDGGLHSIAHQRVAEISACATCMTHALMRPGTAEVLAFNFGSADPIGDAVRQWRSSPTHNAILSDASLGRIGCAQTVVAGTSFFACVLAAGALPAPAPGAPAPGAPAPGGSITGAVAGALPDTSTARLGVAGGRDMLA